jgi:hypothetical protein
MLYCTVEFLYKKPSRDFFYSEFSHLLGRHVEGDSPEVDLLVGVDAGQDEEDAGTLTSPPGGPFACFPFFVHQWRAR